MKLYKVVYETVVPEDNNRPVQVNAYETCYGLPGLGTTAIKPRYWRTARDLYDNTITWEQAGKILPAKARDLFEEEFISDCPPVSRA
ncbi:MAG: hypothetical protein WC003_08865 [Terrimicrobiaceae bacterium]